MIWVLKHCEIPNHNKNGPLHFVYVTLAYSFTLFHILPTNKLQRFKLHGQVFLNNGPTSDFYLSCIINSYFFLQYQNNIKHLNKERIYFVS